MDAAPIATSRISFESVTHGVRLQFSTWTPGNPGSPATLAWSVVPDQLDNAPRVITRLREGRSRLRRRSAMKGISRRTRMRAAVAVTGVAVLAGSGVAQAQSEGRQRTGDGIPTGQIGTQMFNYGGYISSGGNAAAA